MFDSCQRLIFSPALSASPLSSQVLSHKAAASPSRPVLLGGSSSGYSMTKLVVISMLALPVPITGSSAESVGRMEDW